MNPPRIEINSQERFLRGAFLAAALISAIFITGILARFFLENGLSWRCPSMVLLGLPCPGCGTTRALAALVQLHFVEALRLNPLLVIAIVLVLLAPVLKLTWEKFERGHGLTILGAAVLLNWIYLFFFLPR